MHFQLLCHLPICLQDHEISVLKSFQASDAGADFRVEAGPAAQKIPLRNVRICLKSSYHELSFEILPRLCTNDFAKSNVWLVEFALSCFV